MRVAALLLCVVFATSSPAARGAEPDEKPDAPSAEDAARQERLAEQMRKLNEKSAARRGEAPKAQKPAPADAAAAGEAAQLEMDRLNAEAAWRHGDIGPSQPQTVPVRVWLAKADAPDHVRRFLEYGRRDRVTAAERDTAFCHMLRDAIKAELSGGQERSMLVRTNRDMKRLADEIAALCDPTCSLVAGNSMPTRVDDVGWADEKATIIDVIDATSAVVTIDEGRTAILLDGPPTRSYLTGQEVRILGWCHAPGTFHWKTSNTRRIEDVEIEDRKKITILRVTPFEMGEVAEVGEVRVDNPLNPEVRERLAVEGRERNTRIWKLAIQMRKALKDAGEEVDGRAGMTARLRRALSEKGLL